MQLSIDNEILLGEVRRLLLEGKDVILMTKGFSMNPFIVGERDSVLLRHGKDDTYGKGDVVLAEVSEGRFVLHRVLRVADGRLVLRGDGNPSGCETCSPDDVLGKVLALIGPGGHRRRIGKARLWQSLSPSVRQVALTFYRRIILRFINSK